jgi:predicted nucleic acid-binding protein
MTLDQVPAGDHVFVDSNSVLQSKIQVLTIRPVLVSTAATLSWQHGLLTTDAVILALMQAHGLTHLASHDAHFDGLPGITRYAPQ